MVEAAEHDDRVLDVSFNDSATWLRPSPEEDHRRRHTRSIDYAKAAAALRRYPGPAAGSRFGPLPVEGPLMDLGVHMLDIALYLLDEPSIRSNVTAATYVELVDAARGVLVHVQDRRAAGAFDVEDLSTAFLRLQDGGILLLESSWRSGSRGSASTDPYGSDGGASISGVRPMIRIAV